MSDYQFGYQVIQDKSLADCVEALIGAFFQSTGVNGCLDFMNDVLGIPVMFKHILANSDDVGKFISITRHPVNYQNLFLQLTLEIFLYCLKLYIHRSGVLIFRVKSIFSNSQSSKQPIRVLNIWLQDFVQDKIDPRPYYEVNKTPDRCILQ